MKQYLIKLKPIDKFFFGTGKEFGTDNQNYFVESGYLPQQTTLLGMLRYELLKLADESIFKNNRIQDPDKAKKLIGERSFVANCDNDFGQIDSISSVFLMKNDEKLFPQSREYHKENDSCNFLKFSFQDETPILDDYNPKIGISEIWTDKEGKNYTYHDIFKPQLQTGIRKPDFKNKKQDKKKAFYVQTFYKMTKGFYFAFYVDIDDSIKLNDNSIVVLGGERQLFQMRVKDEKMSLKYNYNSSSVEKAILVSDAYIKDDLNNICDFAITDIINFSCLQAHVDKTKKYYSIMKNGADKSAYRENNLYKSDELQLYKKGSVFYFKSDEKKNAFLEAIHNPSFQKIGYNQFKIQTKK